MILALGLLAAPPAAEAQQPRKISRIGYLSAGSGPGPFEEAFRQGLRELGYVEEKNIVIEWRFAGGQEDRLAALAAELVRLKAEIIVTDGTRVTRAARDATKTIPIVMSSDADPIGTGFVASLAHPGGNITGLTNLHPDLSGKRLQLLKEAIPGISRVAVLWNPEAPPSVLAFKETQIAARPLGLRLQALEVRGPNDLEGAFQGATRGRARALTVLSDSLIFAHRMRVLELAAKQRLPTMHTQRLWVEAGGLMSYGTNFSDLRRRAAVYVDKILKGRTPADLPVEQPTRFELVINMKTAKALGITFPQTILIRVDQETQ